MQKKTRTRIGSILLCMAMLLSLLPATALAAEQVAYLDEDEKNQTCQEATDVTADSTEWSAEGSAEAWYVVTGNVTIKDRITVTGDVHLILADDCTLNAEKGISVTTDNSLTIYGQTGGTGKLTARAYQVYSSAAIGGTDDNNTHQDTAHGDITINGGVINATGASNAAGIGGGTGATGTSGTITINGGVVNASSNGDGAGIGGGYANTTNGGDITITGGKVTATGGSKAAGIGAGYSGAGGMEITITGGKVTATGGSNDTYGGAGIGANYGGSTNPVRITINGSADVTATGGLGAAGIGGGSGQASAAVDTIVIGGSAKVKATGGNSGTFAGAGIGAGGNGACGIITIGGSANVTATGGTGETYGGAGIGAGGKGACGNIAIDGGTVKAIGGSNGTYGGAGIGAGGGSNYDFNSGTKLPATGTITISGGKVTATGGGSGKNKAAGIGDGKYGTSGDFSTGENGQAVIYANSISDQSAPSNWSGIVFQGNKGQVYGNVTLDENLSVAQARTLTVPVDSSLTVPEGKKLMVNGALANEGTINVEGTLANNSTLKNEGTINVDGRLNNNTGGTLTNEGTLLVEGTLTNNGTLTNSGSGQTVVFGKLGGTKPEGIIENPEASYTGSDGTVTYCETVADAIKAANENGGGTITLQKNIDSLDEGSTNKNNAVITLPAGTTLDGNGKTISAATDWALDSTTNAPQFHILGVDNCDGNVIVKNLTIVGNARTKHGFNAYGSTNTPKVTLENVTIQNCGTAAVVVNHADVTAIDLTTSGNPWGAVNVDKNGKLTLEGDNNSMAEPVKIWTEASSGTAISVANSNYAEFKNVTGVGTNLKGHTYYTDDVSDLGVAYNGTTNTIYETLEEALSKAESGNTVTVVKNTEVTTNATVASGVTLVVNPGVTLEISEGKTLTNNGTIQNNGTISGTVETGTSGTPVKSTVTISVTPRNATITVTKNGGSTMTGTNGVYLLEDGTYSYTVSASGYYTKSGTFTVAGQAQTIPVSLTAIPTTPDTPSYDGGSSEPSGDYIVSVDRVSGGKVTVNPGRADKGDEVTITVKPNDGYELDELVVTDSRGNEVRVYAESSTKFTFTMPSGTVDIKATFVKTDAGSVLDDFADLNPNAWYAEAVEFVIEEGLMTGTSAAAFAPDASMSRAMIWTVLAAYNGYNTSGGNPWYAPGQQWAMVNGVSDGTSPDGSITREQLAVMLWRAAGSPETDKSLSSYADASSVSDWAETAMAWAVDNGIITGMGGSSLAPQTTATRAQVAVMLMQFVNYMED